MKTMLATILLNWINRREYFGAFRFRNKIKGVKGKK